MGSTEDSAGRRRLLRDVGAALLAGALPGCAMDARRDRSAAMRGGPAAPPAAEPAAAPRSLPPVHAAIDRITAITVCTRPFRAQGPRLDVEQIGRQSVVHNYGHGGSGWSLSWGSSTIAVEQALATGERDIAVIGCGALGLTSALLLQRAGARVTIHAKDLPPNVRSSLATGVWSPDSRICLQEQATPAFRQLWERMARTSYRTYQSLLRLPGDPIEYFDLYALSDEDPWAEAPASPPASAPPEAGGALPPPGNRPAFAQLQRELIGDLMPAAEELAPGGLPFAARYARRAPLLMYNLPAYSRLLMSDFLAGGGRIVVEEFHTPADFARLPQKTLINATGYGARALCGDRSITPVRGQLAHLIPQPEVRYGLQYRHVSFIPRRDGPVLQVAGADDYYGFGDDGTAPDRVEAELAVNTIAGLFSPPVARVPPAGAADRPGARTRRAPLP